MTRPDRHYDWQSLRPSRRKAPMPVDGGRRMRWLGIVFTVAVVTVFSRAAAIVLFDGRAWRYHAAQPIEQRESLPAMRGRILARDGTVLAQDQQVPSLAMHYRYLEDPPNPAWLRSMARARLSPQQRGDREAMRRAMQAVRRELADEHRRLAGLCGLQPDVWKRRIATIQRRVRRIAEHVNRARQSAREKQAVAGRDRADRPREEGGVARSSQADRAAGSTAQESQSWWNGLRRHALEAVDHLVDPDEPPVATAPITVAEELDYHVVAEGISLEAVAAIESAPARYPGVRIDLGRRREYPSVELAAHVLGYLGPVDQETLAASQSVAAPYEADDRVGRSGVERRYEPLLRGKRGLRIRYSDRSGRILRSHVERPPEAGLDLVLSIDPRLQRAAERLLDAALERRDTPRQGGGAVVVLDVRSGELLASASSPRFDPNQFAETDPRAIQALLEDPEQRLLDRAIQMALPPGSVFKVLSAIALLESGALSPDAPFHCRGYLHDPEHWRCQLFVHRGVGHGDIVLADALARSCNVYFFHHAARAGPEAIVDWALRLGFGNPTGVDLPYERTGNLPRPHAAGTTSRSTWHTADTQALAIGQSQLTATPLQVVRLLAAVANGGKLVTPHVVRGLAIQSRADEVDGSPLDRWFDHPVRPVAGLDAEVLRAVRRGLEQAVSDPLGTAHDTVYLESVPIAGKTGTAETGHDADGRRREDHAWFAGYVPADRPRLAFVVVLEHAGNGSTAAGPVARRLVAWMDRLGLLGRR